jgi:hypothetical protein
VAPLTPAGAAAALVAAAERADRVGAVISRGGRPDLAWPALPHVRAPTLLIVGGNDVQVIQLNRAALAQLRCEKLLVIVLRRALPGSVETVAVRLLESVRRKRSISHMAIAE